VIEDIVLFVLDLLVKQNSPIGCITCDGHSVAGRGGAGSVMGSKKLKAIAILGTKQVTLYDANKVKNKSLELMRIFAKRLAEKRETGTTSAPTKFEAIGNLPIKYWTGESWPETQRLIKSVRQGIRSLNIKLRFCANCPYGCHRHIKLEEPEKYAVEGSGPEYETLALMGSSFLCSDLPAIAKA